VGLVEWLPASSSSTVAHPDMAPALERNKDLSCTPLAPQLRVAAVNFDPYGRRPGCRWLCWWHR